MTKRTKLTAYLLALGLGLGLAFVAFGTRDAHGQCAPGQAPPYCSGGGGGGGGGTTQTTPSSNASPPPTFTTPSGNVPAQTARLVLDQLRVRPKRFQITRIRSHRVLSSATRGARISFRVNKNATIALRFRRAKR